MFLIQSSGNATMFTLVLKAVLGSSARKNIREDSGHGLYTYYHEQSKNDRSPIGFGEWNGHASKWTGEKMELYRDADWDSPSRRMQSYFCIKEEAVATAMQDQKRSWRGNASTCCWPWQPRAKSFRSITLIVERARSSCGSLYNNNCVWCRKPEDTRNQGDDK